MTEKELMQNEVILVLNKANIISLKISKKEFFGMYNHVMYKAIQIGETLANRMEDYVGFEQLSMYDFAHSLSIRKSAAKWNLRSFQKEYNYELTIANAIMLCRLIQYEKPFEEEQTFLEKLHKVLMEFGFSNSYLKI
jgi:hypothetical protein